MALLVAAYSPSQSWWLLTLVVDPAMADEYWEYALVATYLLAPVWAHLLAGFATWLRVSVGRTGQRLKPSIP